MVGGEKSNGRWRYFHQSVEIFPTAVKLFLSFWERHPLNITKIRLSGAYCTRTSDKISLLDCCGYFMRFRNHVPRQNIRTSSMLCARFALSLQQNKCNMMEKEYKSEVGWIYHLVIGLVIVGCVHAFLKGGVVPIVASLLAALLVLHIFFNTYYFIYW